MRYRIRRQRWEQYTIILLTVHKSIFRRCNLKTEIVVVGGGFAGCAAAASAARTGAHVTLLERTDMLLGNGLAAGFMDSNGRFTAAKEAIFLGGGDIFTALDSITIHRDVEIPKHKHGTTYKNVAAEPLIRGLLRRLGVDVLFERLVRTVERKDDKIVSVSAKNNETFVADAFVDCSGTAGGPENCTRYGVGCVSCVLRCHAFGSRVSIATKAGVRELVRLRVNGTPGVFSGAIALQRDSVAPEILSKLEEKGSLLIPLRKEDVHEDKLFMKACSQFSEKEFAENLVLLDVGYPKIVTPFFPLERLRAQAGFENAWIEEPMAGGKGNSIRFLSIAPRDDALKVEGLSNTFCAGEKSGPIVGVAEAIVTGHVAGHNAVREALGKDLLILPRSIAIGDFITFVGERMRMENGLRGLSGGLSLAGGLYFEERMKPSGLYTTDMEEIRRRIDKAGLTGVLAKKEC